MLKLFKTFIMNSVNVNVKFVQGANELTISNLIVETTKISEVSGTLARKVLTARANMKRYGFAIKGFSFNRKFDVVLSINGQEGTNINELFAGLGDFKITLQTTESSFKKFADIIHDLVFEQMTGASQMVYELDEVKEVKLIG